jgi:[ribosomal protein S5]-alanine N-acetyltransferase
MTSNDKLIFRKPDLEDLESLYILKNDIESNSSLVGITSGFSKVAIRDWIEFHQKAKDEVLYLIQRVDTGNVIGHVGIYKIDHRIRKGEIAIVIAEKGSRGKGFGNICLEFILEFGFNQLNLNRIELSVLADNEIAISLYLKHGFVKEGCLRQAQFKNGKYHDVVLMAKFKGD